MPVLVNWIGREKEVREGMPQWSYLEDISNYSHCYMCAIYLTVLCTQWTSKFLYEIHSLSRYFEVLDLFKSRSSIIMLLLNSFLKLMGNTVGIGIGIVKPPFFRIVYSVLFFIGLREVGGKFAKDLFASV